jgi:probable rRNA maturation factor
VWLNRQRGVPARLLQLPALRQAVQQAWPDVVAEVRDGSVLGELAEISFVLVSDRVIAGVHGTFLEDPTATDVITFHHGEIVISTATAQREARQRGLPLPQEVARYAVHGLLHLAGWTDETRAEAAAMRAVQEKILRRACRGLC